MDPGSNEYYSLNEANLNNLPNAAGSVAPPNINALIEEDDAHNADLKDEISEFSGFSSSIHSGKDSKDKSFIMRNGCCKECMKAFSKSGKVLVCIKYRVACVKSPDFREELHYHQMDASSVDAKVN